MLVLVVASTHSFDKAGCVCFLMLLLMQLLMRLMILLPILILLHIILLLLPLPLLLKIRMGHLRGTTPANMQLVWGNGNSGDLGSCSMCLH